jgi:hypothetical protein
MRIANANIDARAPYRDAHAPDKLTVKKVPVQSPVLTITEAVTTQPMPAVIVTAGGKVWQPSLRKTAPSNTPPHPNCSTPEAAHTSATPKTGKPRSMTCSLKTNETQQFKRRQKSTVCRLSTGSLPFGCLLR